MVRFHSVSRNTPLSMSAAPDTTRQASATPTPGARPNPTIAAPQADAASAMARPCLRTRPAHPLTADAAMAPAELAENISPTAHGACSCAAMNGNSEPGYASVIAARSARYEPTSSWRPRAYRRPASTPACRGRSAARSAGDVGSGRSRPSSAKDAANETASAA
jgi:hypothetical protein